MKEEEENRTAPDPEVKNPGECIGHWLEGDEACAICEIEESCKKMTEEILEEDK